MTPSKMVRLSGLLSFLSVCALLSCSAQDAGKKEEGEDPAKDKQEEGFVDLFNKKNLDGWSTPYDWGEVKIVNEEIHLKANRKFFVLTKKQYADFIFEGEIMMPDAESNSGFMFRCAAERNNTWGYQAEVDPSARGWSGGLYDEARRGWLNPKKDDKASIEAFTSKGDALKLTEWNHYRIHAEGDHLRIWVNGKLTTDVRDSMDSQGHLAIQHHGEKGKVYRFRNLRIKELTPALGEEVTLFDGKTLAGFSGLDGKPAKGWEVEKDTIHLKDPEGADDLYIDGDWGNFELTFEWKIAEKGRGGLGYRFAPTGDGGKGKWKGPVFAMLDHERNKEQGRDKKLLSGAMLGVSAAAGDAPAKKPGEWNSTKIYVYRDRITHVLNGKNAVRLSMLATSWKRDLKKSKFADVDGFATGKGRLVLLNRGAPAWFKNLKITVLR